MQSIKSLLRKLKKAQKLKERGLYAVTAGDHIGEFYVLHKHLGDELVFCQLPDFKTVQLKDTTVQLGLSSGVLELVKVLPTDVHTHILKEFEGRKKLSDKPK
jgi:hypothetical protein